MMVFISYITLLMQLSLHLHAHSKWLALQFNLLNCGICKKTNLFASFKTGELNQEATVESDLETTKAVFYNSEDSRVWISSDDSQPGLYWQEVKAPEQWKPNTRTKDAALAAIDRAWKHINKHWGMNDIVDSLEA